MFLDRFRKNDEALEAAIAKGFKYLEQFDLDDNEADLTIQQLTKLYDLKRRSINPDTLAVVSSNVGIAVALILFEKSNVITTKVPQFLSKLR